MKLDDAKIWNSIELYDMYVSLNCKDLSCKQLIQHLQDSFGLEFLVLSSSGVASVVVFHSKAAAFRKLLPADDDDNDIALSKVSKKIL